LQDANDHTQFILYEAYATPEDAAAHKDSLHYLMWRETVAKMMAKPREGIKYVSSNANPLTDALALSGMTAFRDGFFVAWEGKEAGRSQLAYAALLSGITLAQTGLGSVHGLASPLGAFFPCPHGVVCGTLLAEATDINILALRERDPNSIALTTERLALPKLSVYGMQPSDLDKVVANCRGSSMKTNPIVLTDTE